MKYFVLGLAFLSTALAVYDGYDGGYGGSSYTNRYGAIISIDVTIKKDKGASTSSVPLNMNLIQRVTTTEVVKSEDGSESDPSKRILVSHSSQNGLEGPVAANDMVTSNNERRNATYYRREYQRTKRTNYEYIDYLFIYQSRCMDAQELRNNPDITYADWVSGKGVALNPGTRVFIRASYGGDYPSAYRRRSAYGNEDYSDFVIAQENDNAYGVIYMKVECCTRLPNINSYFGYNKRSTNNGCERGYFKDVDIVEFVWDTYIDYNQIENLWASDWWPVAAKHAWVKATVNSRVSMAYVPVKSSKSYIDNYNHGPMTYGSGYTGGSMGYTGGSKGYTGGSNYTSSGSSGYSTNKY